MLIEKTTSYHIKMESTEIKELLDDLRAMSKDYTTIKIRETIDMLTNALK